MNESFRRCIFRPKNAQTFFPPPGREYGKGLAPFSRRSPEFRSALRRYLARAYVCLLAICGALIGIAHLHALKWLHLDIKPANILHALCRRKGKIADLRLDDVLGKIGDFGHVHNLDYEGVSNIRDASSIGTPFYRANESGECEVHKGMDMFAAGVTVLETFSASRATP